MAAESALLFSGWLKVTTPTPSSTLKRTAPLVVMGLWAMKASRSSVGSAGSASGGGTYSTDLSLTQPSTGVTRR